MRYIKSILAISFVFMSVVIYAQSGTLRGHIYDENTGEPVIFANVIFQNTDIGGTTDVNGFFNISEIPEGTYTMSISYLGYEEYIEEIEIRSGKIENSQIYLSETGVNLGVVNISAARQQAKTEVGISKLQVSKKQIKALPSTGGEPDILQYLQVLPGVITTGDQGGQIFIRGGSPVQNKILLDGLTIYNPFHSIGFFSIFETELIKNVDVLTGGFNAKHGGRISAIVDISTREGNRSRLAGQVSASPFMVKGLLEVPIIKLKEDKKGTSSSFVFTAKKSLIDETSKTLYSYAAVNDSIGLPFSFTDLYSKLSFVTSNGSKINFFGFNYDDEYNDPNVAKIGWTNSGGGMTFTLLPNASSIIMDGIIGFSNYETGIVEDNNTPRNSSIRELLLGLNFDYFGNEYDIKYGIEVKSIRTEFDFVNPFGLALDQNQNTTEISGFMKYRQVLNKLVLEPSVRIQYYASLSEFSVEPRFGLKYNIADDLRFKLAGGIYSQNLISTSNERDVVNLFTGFLSGPNEQFLDLEGVPVTSKLQKSQHIVGGFEYDLTDNIQINLEGYLKDFNQLVIVNRNKVDPLQPDYATEEGQAYGVDLSVKYERPQWYFWGTYSYGMVNRFDGFQEYNTVFDRRHNINFLGTYTMGKERDWQFSFRYNFGSGFPFTKTQGFYNHLTFLEGVSTDYTTSNPENVGIIYSDERNGGRLPNYHRVDISAQKTITFSKYTNLEIVASVTNAGDRNNIFYFDRVEYDRVDQLPIIPSLAMRFNF